MTFLTVFNPILIFIIFTNRLPTHTMKYTSLCEEVIDNPYHLARHESYNCTLFPFWNMVAPYQLDTRNYLRWCLWSLKYTQALYHKILVVLSWKLSGDCVNSSRMDNHTAVVRFVPWYCFTHIGTHFESRHWLDVTFL